MLGIGLGIGIGKGRASVPVGAPAGGDPGPKTVNAVQFDGSNDWLERDADLTGIVDNKVGLLSYWFDPRGGDATNMHVLANSTVKMKTWRHSGGTLRVLCQDGGLILNMLSTGSYVAANGWIHLLASWDLGNAKAHLYIDDADDLNVGALTLVDGVIGYSASDWAVGADVAGGNKLNADLAELYFTNEYMDITVESNRRKFRTSLGKPALLGADGSDPTGTAPLVFLEGATPSWHTNDGSGGGMTEFGALTDGASSPSD